MIDLFDKLGNTLNDLIGSHQNNNVNHVATQLFAEGGLAGSDVGSRDPYSLGNILSSAGQAIDKAVSATGKHSAYNDPYFTTPHLTSAYGKFFTGADTGSTNKPIGSPDKVKIQQSENPNDFFSRWYESMRRFAQSEEVANRGQTQIRSR